MFARNVSHGVWIGLTALLALSAHPTPLEAQERIRVGELQAGFTVLYANEGSGNTIVFRGEDGTFLVDTMADSVSSDLARALDGLGVDDVRYVANTHWHQNHLGGNDRFSDSAVILGSEALRTRLQSEQRLEFLVDQTFPALPEAFWPTVTFDDAVSVHFNGEAIEILHLPGHTDSDAVVVWPRSAVAATGDLWTPGGWIAPDIDTGGSLVRVEAVLRELAARLPPEVKIVPGHGRPGTLEELRDYVEGLRLTNEYVRVATDAGRDLSQIIDEVPGEVADRLGPSTARLLEASYGSSSSR
ncbi:MAG: MBL fold metallo-hydrolase [Gemmatimonadota bacterium]|nr:MBL fold metallo-hydrolase [Gemmatimonadota bacterium]